MICSVRGQTSSSLAYTSNVTHAVLTGVWMGAEARFLAKNLNSEFRCEVPSLNN